MSEYDFKWDDLPDSEKVASRARISEELARARHKDYGAVTKPAIERMNNDDDFRRELSQADDPAELLYETGKAMSSASLEEIFGE
ncbi:MAG: hypothetical protein KME67_10815 [Candidatus Thiodiazotropha sp. (ex Codakia orbicularis)]|nr:hypothetical protein [Candidatus Thiodiazotropha sp. (ex Codakia orbicularis)]